MNKTAAIVGLITNLLFGYILVKYLLIVYLLFFLSFTQLIGWNLDPTMEEGLFFPMLIISLLVTALYFIPLTLLNIKVYCILRVTKVNYIMGIVLLIIIGGIIGFDFDKFY
ncbi:multidrug resistance protein [Evansella cellulosilytica DSM 2522]|uniref:Multidrug resistance protein n=1 Tax=Evansella cellulosilytica (strain ATCC 21833 / DSM 2522 / FERM P-1141 / JCM 9156 / N-4) TaxID=649639 RepID=E6TU60_EVAC2|nr:multidrug resistance protein [Evansella cellulosilytica DSM 2522]